MYSCAGPISVDKPSRRYLSAAASSPILEDHAAGSLSERIDALGGRFEIESEPGTGTRVVATLPIDRDPALDVAAPTPSPVLAAGPGAVVALPAPDPR